MGMSVKLRGLGVAIALFSLSVSGSIVATVGTMDVAVAQTALRIDIEGNRRVEAETIRAYFRVNPGDRLDAVVTAELQEVDVPPDLGAPVVVHREKHGPALLRGCT